MSARLFVAASTNQTNAVANILWLAGITRDPDLLHQYVEPVGMVTKYFRIVHYCTCQFSTFAVKSKIIPIFL